MKKFKKSVSDMLLGKYGILWDTNARGYIVKYTTKVWPGHEIEYYAQMKALYPDAMENEALLGILDYEVETIRDASGDNRNLFGVRVPLLGRLGDLVDAKDIVRAEIRKTQSLDNEWSHKAGTVLPGRIY